MITDTGVGTDVPSCHSSLSSFEIEKKTKEKRWNIATFISHHLNPRGEIPYLVILSHCHYDHILGLPCILHAASRNGHGPTHIQILVSDYDRSFITPHAKLQEHSLCNAENLICPELDVAIWARDQEEILYRHPHGVQMSLPIMTLHSPGHTPDSLTWYDTKERVLYVGDSFYAQRSKDSDDAPWEEGEAPILFPNEGNLALWWFSITALLNFAQRINSTSNPLPLPLPNPNPTSDPSRTKLSAGHVTVSEDAEEYLSNVKEFMRRIIKCEVPFEEGPRKRGERFGIWKEEGGMFSLGAPVRVVEEGRERIAREE